MPQNTPTLQNDERLFAGQFLKSKNGLFHALMQDDGNFVVYRGDLFATKEPGYEKTAVWSVYPAGHAPGGGTGYHIYMQSDGNLCIYRQDPQAVTWVCEQTHKNRKADGRVLTLWDDGRLDISGIWNSDSGDGYGDVEFEQVDYIVDPPPKIISLGPPRVSLSQIATNDSSVEQSQTLTVSYQETKSHSWKVSTSLKIGAKTTVKASIPLLADGKIETSAEFTQGFEWNETKSSSETKSISMTVKVPPGKSIVGKCTWKESKYSLPFRAVGKIKFNNYPEMLPVHLEGVFDGISTSEIRTFWKELPPDLDKPLLGGGATAGLEALGDDGWHEVKSTSVAKE